MIAVVKKPKAGKAGPARPASASQKPIEPPNGLWERIAGKAYELWEQRGRREGNALGDWLDAEEIVMEEVHEARE